MSKTHLPSSSQSAASNTLSAQDWLDKGNTLFAKQKLQAIAAYDRAIQLKPDDALYHCSKGKVLQMLGNEQLALEFYNKAYEISKTASLGSNLSQGNIQYIKNTLSKDRESLLLNEIERFLKYCLLFLRLQLFRQDEYSFAYLDSCKKYAFQRKFHFSLRAFDLVHCLCRKNKTLFQMNCYLKLF